MKWQFPLTKPEKFCTRKQYLDHLREEIKKFAQTIGLEIQELEVRFKKKGREEEIK